MNVFEAFILGLIQGLTEFLPVSSSGHLAIASAFFGIADNNMAITIILHAATFLAIVAAYFKTVVNLIKEFFIMLWRLVTFKGLELKENKYRRYIIYIIVATIPAAVAGYLLDDYVESALTSLSIVAMMLMLTGLLLMLAAKLSKNTKGDIENLGPVKSFVVGLFQMCAIFPGLSRSGTTMTGGIVMGLKKEDALEFSFLLALPTILGSIILKAGEISDAIARTDPVAMAVGFATALVVGYLAIQLFNVTVKKGSVIWFAAYCWIAGVILILKIGGFF
jgi:undecaprenyl-diphosphatase